MRFISLILFFLLLPGLSSGASVGFDSPGLGAMPGEEATVNLTLDAAPAGISGFALTIVVEDPSVAEITGAVLPEWAELSDIAGVPGPEISIMAADIGGAVEKDSGEVMLATLTIRSLSPGTTDIVLREPVFDDDDGNEIAPALSGITVTVAAGGSTIPVTTVPDTTLTTSPASTTVTGTTTGGSAMTGSSGGGGSGGGSYYLSGTVPATTVATGTATSAPPVTTPADQPGIQATGNAGTETSPPTLSATIPESTEPVSGSQGIPFLTVPGVMVLIGALILLGRKMR